MFSSAAWLYGILVWLWTPTCCTVCWFGVDSYLELQQFCRLDNYRADIRQRKYAGELRGRWKSSSDADLEYRAAYGSMQSIELSRYRSAFTEHGDLAC
jgi:hypothetical protein